MSKAQKIQEEMQDNAASAPVEIQEDAPKAGKTVVESITMEDGRVVAFAGKRRLIKTIVLEHNKAAVRMDLRNGVTRTFHVPHEDLLQYAAHGASQKLGDEISGEDDLDDCVIALDDLMARLNKHEWTVRREAGDGFAGASIIIRALCEAAGKTVDEIKAYLEGRIQKAKDAGETLTRKDLYNSFRNPESKTGKIIKRMEEEKLVKSSKVNADDELADLMGA